MQASRIDYREKTMSSQGAKLVVQGKLTFRKAERGKQKESKKRSTDSGMQMQEQTLSPRWVRKNDRGQRVLIDTLRASNSGRGGKEAWNRYRAYQECK